MFERCDVINEARADEVPAWETAGELLLDDPLAERFADGDGVVRCGRRPRTTAFIPSLTSQ